MSGTRSPSKTEPATDRRWPFSRLALLLYPFVVLALWINLFMIALMGTWLGLPSLSPGWALALAVLLGGPVCYAATRWLWRLLDRAAD